MAKDKTSETTGDDDTKRERWSPSETELREIRQKHQKWLSTTGEEGERADFRNADLSGKRLAEADLSKADLWAADLSEAFLPGANLSKAFLPWTDLSRADLPIAVLREAKLANADLSGADLAEADLAKADLRDADLSGVTGLQAHRLQGADVSNATLPEAVAAFEGLGVVKEASMSARKLFVSVLVACVYSAVTVATTSAGSAEILTLPIVNVEIGVAAFYLVTSALLAPLFAYFHLQMQRVWEEIAALPAVFPDGRTLDAKIHPWLVTGLARAHVKRLKERPPPPFFPVQRFVVVALAWGAVPLTLGYFATMYLWRYGPWGSAFLLLLAVLATGGAVASYRKATQTLTLQPHAPLRLWTPDSSEPGQWALHSTSVWITLGLFVLATIAWFVRY